MSQQTFNPTFSWPISNLCCHLQYRFSNVCLLRFGEFFNRDTHQARLS
ncbi:Uncharacterized protein APZ42_028106 [Daphnia magna]|uniref:Uncharacterized protein n=1 Tax=Daphnia magna TaxID=35525 RepID=A0A162D7P6_9CRUS|nr:Uncharacterized protein APZ42_028106 [Daphnia magna]